MEKSHLAINLSVCTLRLREGGKVVSPKGLVFFFSNGILLLGELPALNLLPPRLFIHSSLPSQFFLINIWIPNHSLYFQDASSDLTFPGSLLSLLLQLGLFSGTDLGILLIWYSSQQRISFNVHFQSFLYIL